MSEATGTVRLSALADELIQAKADLELAEAMAVRAKKEVARLEEQVIPSLMDELEMSEVKTSGGLTVRVANKLSANKLTERHAAALQWLKDNGEGGCIKTEVSVPFRAGSESDADQLIDRLSGEGIAASKSVEVNASTLAAVLRRKLEDGLPVPLDAFGAYQRRVATVEVKK